MVIRALGADLDATVRIFLDLDIAVRQLAVPNTTFAYSFYIKKFDN